MSNELTFPTRKEQWDHVASLSKAELQLVAFDLGDHKIQLLQLLSRHVSNAEMRMILWSMGIDTQLSDDD